MSEPSQDHQHAFDDASVSLIYFFFPLPEAVGLPLGHTIQFFDGYPLPDEDELEHLTASLKFHLVDTEISSRLVGLPLQVMAGAFGWDQADKEFNPPPMPAKVTIVEAAIRASEFTEDARQDALEEALQRVEQVQHAYFGVSQHAVPSVSPQSLPPMIPSAFRTAIRGETAPQWPAESDWVPHWNVHSHLIGKAPPELSKNTLSAMSVINDNPNGPFFPLLAIRRELAFANNSKSYSTAAVLCGTSSEILFRELLSILLWEEGREARDAADTLSERSVVNLVRREFHPRLGGRWSTEDGGVIADWNDNIRKLRNRVVHFGHRPSTEEFDLAMTAFSRLDKFVGDRLAASLRSYPLSAMAFLGERGLERRTAIKRYERIVKDLESPTSLQSTFASWRHELERVANDGPWVGDASRGVVIWIRYGNGSERYWLFDEATQLCCKAKEPEMTIGQEQVLSRIRADVQGLDIAVSVLVESDGLPLQDDPKWIPACDILPLRTHSRFPICQIPPA